MNDSRCCHQLFRRCLKLMKYNHTQGELNQLRESLFKRSIQEFKLGKAKRFVFISLFFILLHELQCVCAFGVYCGLSVCVVLKSAFSILGCACVCVCVCVCVCCYGCFQSVCVC